MNTVALVVEPRISELRITEAEITAYLVDGRTVSVPLAWSWRLSEATPSQRNHWELIGDALGFTCLRLMKTSVSKACSMAHRHQDRLHL